EGRAFRVLRLCAVYLRRDAERDRLSGHLFAACAPARRRRTLAEARHWCCRHDPARDLQLWPSDRHVRAGERDLPAGEPRELQYRSDRLAAAQRGAAVTAALSAF